MPDREKVIRAVETCFDSWIERHRDKDLDLHAVERLKREALELLKEQDPVKPIRLENWWKCPSCSGNIVANMKYCPRCGKAVTWDA